MQQKNMKLPERKKTAEEKMYPTMASGPQEEYPYGLRLRLDDEQLKALGIKELPEHGSELSVEATGHVCSTNSREDEGGVNRSFEVQITHLALGKAK